MSSLAGLTGLPIMDEFVWSFNTGNSIDIMTGIFVPGIDGSMILKGGLRCMNGRQGRPQHYKTSSALSDIVNCWARFPGADLFIADIEETTDEARARQMATIPIPPENSIKFIDAKVTYMEDLYNTVYAISQYKQKHRKEYTVQTPILNELTGEPRSTLIPTFILVDSLSQYQVKKSSDILLTDAKLDDNGYSAKGSISSGDKQTVNMVEGLIKGRILRELSVECAKSNIVMVFTAHIASVNNMSAMPSPKVIQHMRQDEKPKRVGSDYLYLMMSLLENKSVSVLKDSGKTVYPSKSGMVSEFDLNRVTEVVIRAKGGGGSGTSITSVYSQILGKLVGLSYYDYLKANNNFGLLGGNIVSNMLYPDVKLQRTTAFDLTRTDPLLQRALEITAQLCYIQNNWTLIDSPVPFDISPDKLMEKLMASGYTGNDILNSRGWWTYIGGEKDFPPYLSLFDVLAIVQGTYKPKLYGAKSVDKK